MNRLLCVLLGCWALSAMSCATIEMATVSSLSKLEPAELDLKTGRIAIFWPEAFTQHDVPSIDFWAKKDGQMQIEGRIKFLAQSFKTDQQKQVSGVPDIPSAAGELIIYRLDPEQYALAERGQQVLLDAKQSNTFWGGAKWEGDWHRNFAFTVNRDAYRAFCARKASLDISVWVKVNAKRACQSLVDDKSIDNFVSGQMRRECKNTDTFLITPSVGA